jgi:hypothetical protein
LVKKSDVVRLSGDKKSDVFDVRLTYALLIGALGLEAISVLMLIFSDRTLLALKRSWRKFIPEIILKRARWSGSVSDKLLLE